MRDLLTTPKQTQPKSITDLTPFELSEIEAYQNHNRGFRDDTDEDLEMDFGWEER